jgi:hypothetical protein
MTDQDQSQDQLPQPRLGHRQIEEHVIGRGFVRSKGLVQSLLGGGGLLVDKLATDLVLAGQPRNRLRLGQSLHSQFLPRTRTQAACGTVAHTLLLHRGRRKSRMDAHVCFLHETGGGMIPPVWGEQTI